MYITCSESLKRSTPRLTIYDWKTLEVFLTVPYLAHSDKHFHSEIICSILVFFKRAVIKIPGIPSKRTALMADDMALIVFKPKSPIHETLIIRLYTHTHTCT